ncbi:MAG: adenine phosphoribosyltransferase [Cytophagales bacterium]|nr:adenine phosphoribosyltransferase [Cytophagales bacterium]
METIQERIKSSIRDIKDFPKEGIIFKDITPILSDVSLSNDIVEEFVKSIQEKGIKIDAVACIEARGFLFGPMIAQRLSVPFIPIRKKGKLPYDTISYEYDLEYGSAVIEMHKDAVQKDWNVLIHDDLLATGGTAIAAAELIKTEGNVAGFSFLVDLTFLDGNKKLKEYSDNVLSLIKY